MNYQFKKMDGSSGFSLVELIVVVAVLSVLASISIPMYSKFSFKAKQSGGKTLLAALYTAEKSFYAEYSVYHTAFPAIGFSPEGNLHHNVGFSTQSVVNYASYGYRTPLTIVESQDFQSNIHCDSSLLPAGTPGMPGNSCRVMMGVDGLKPPYVSFGTATETDFLAGAMIIVPAGMMAMENPIPSGLPVLHALYPFIQPQVAHALRGEVEVLAISMNSEKNTQVVTCPFPDTTPPDPSWGPEYYNIFDDVHGVIHCNYWREW